MGSRANTSKDIFKKTISHINIKKKMVKKDVRSEKKIMPG